VFSDAVGIPDYKWLILEGLVNYELERVISWLTQGTILAFTWRNRVKSRKQLPVSDVPAEIRNRYIPKASL